METSKEWPKQCKFCGSDTGTPSHDDSWFEFMCGTEVDRGDGGFGWTQDDDCRIAELQSQLTAATARAEGLEKGISEFIQWTIDTDHEVFDEQVVRETLRSILAGTFKRA